MTLGLDAYASSDGNEDEDIVPTRLARSVAAAPNVDSGALALERDEDSARMNGESCPWRRRRR